MPVTRTMARERPSLLSPPPGPTPAKEGRESSSTTSPYSLSNEDMQLTDELFDNDNDNQDLTTSGRTYEELVAVASREEEHPSSFSSQQRRRQQQGQPRNSMMSEETEEDEESEGDQSRRRRGRQSVGFMLGRNSISNWSAIGNGRPGRRGLLDDDDDHDHDDDDIPRSVHMDHIMNTGRKSNVSRHSLGRDSLGLDCTPNITSVSHVNVSQRRGTVRSTANGNNSNARLSRPSHKMARGGGGGRRSNSLNVSHISSSSKSDATGEDVLGDSWSPIRASLETSFARSTDASPDDGRRRNGGTSIIGLKGSGSLSPVPGRTSNSLSPKKAMPKSPTRRASPRRSTTKSKSPVRSSVRSQLGDISPKKATSKSSTRRSLSPKRSPTKSRSPVRSPVRSPLGDISPNRGRSPNRGTSPKRGTAAAKSPLRTSTSMALPKKKALSPNGTYSLKEAEGSRLSMSPGAATDCGSLGGSNGMGSQAPASSATLLTEIQTQAALEETAPPASLPNSHQVLENVVIPENAHASQSAATVARVHHEDAMMMQSPEKHTMKNHARSPAPTPNSRRKVIKRFRASIPTANYLIPEDMLENSLEGNPNRKDEECRMEDTLAQQEENVHHGEETSEVAKPMEAEEPEEPKQAPYENAFVFPSDSIPKPRTKTLIMFHDQAVATGSISHQYQLNRAGTNQLSLQEVILPSIAYETSSVLKHMQAKAQRHANDGKPDSQGKEVVRAIETCRRVVQRCTGEAMKVAGEAWRERQKERERLILERLREEVEQRRSDKLKAKKERKEARARSRMERYERQKLEEQRNHPRNKEMWQEVTKLMVDIQKLEKEERLWKEALVEVEQLEKHHQPPEKMDLDPIARKDTDDQLLKNLEDANLESTSATMVEDVTMATERINWMLKSVSLAMDESDKVRKEAYDKYQYDGHKFYGYPKVDDSKGLFMALSMESPLRD